MSSIDERIVQMQFNNKDFEKGVSETLKSLEKLKTSSDFDGSSKGLKDLSDTAKNISFSKLEEALDTVTSRFSTLGIIGMTALQNITNQAIDTGKQMISSLTTDQISAGWDKYAKKTSAVQTIMAATRKQFSDTGVQMKFVTEQLEKLNWFTDETSYNFTDMVDNIGKFTSNNIALDTSVTAMQGIATWAAISGANTESASRAMYNLAQAISVGAVKLIDWKSIENANMATTEFKETAIETALAMGTLQKAADGTITTLQKGLVVTAEDFHTGLADGWFTTDVLLSVLDNYGGFTDKLYEVSQKTGLTATELLGYIEDYETGALNVEKIASEVGMTASELTGIFNELSDSTYDLGRRSLQAGQEAKTFQEAIDSVKDAVSTGWMNTFELIFGDYTEAKKLWTDVANGLYDIFAESGNARNEMLKEWRNFEIPDADKLYNVTTAWDEAGRAIVVFSDAVTTLDGREILLEGFSNAFEAFGNIIGTVKESFRDIFPPMTAEKLINMTIGFRDATEKLKNFFSASEDVSGSLENQSGKSTKLVGKLEQFKYLYDANSDSLEGYAVQAKNASDQTVAMSSPLEIISRTMKGLFSGIAIGVDFIKALGNAMLSLVKRVLPAFAPVAEFVASIGDKITALREKLQEDGFFENWGEKLGPVFDKLSGYISKGVTRLSEFGGKVIDIFKKSGLWDKIKTKFGELASFLEAKIPNVLDSLASFAGGILDWIEQSQLVQKIVDGISQAFDWVSNQGWFTKLSSFLSYMVDTITGFVSAMKTALSDFFGLNTSSGNGKKLKGIFSDFDYLYEATDKIADKSFLERIMERFGAFDTVSEWFKTALENFKTNWTNIYNFFANVIEKINGVITSIVTGITNAVEWIKSKTQSVDLGKTLMTILGIGSLLVILKTLYNFSKIGKQLKKGLTSIGSAIKNFGKKDIIKKDSLGTSLLKIAGAIGILAAAVVVLTTIDPDKLKKGMESIGILAAGLGGFSILGGIVNKLTGGGISGLGKSIISIAGGVALLSGAMIVLSYVDGDKIAKGLLTIGLVLGELVGFMALTKGGGFKNNAQLIQLGVAVLAISVVFNKMASFDWEQIAKGAVGLGAVLLELAVAMRILTGGGFSGFEKGTSLKIISIVAGLYATSLIFEKFTKFSWEEIGKGVAGLATVVGTLVGMMVGLKFAGQGMSFIDFLGEAGALILGLAGLWAGMQIFADGMRALSDFDGADIKDKAEGFAFALLSLGTVIAMFGKLGIMSTIEGAGGFAIVVVIIEALTGLLGFIEELTGASAMVDKGAEVLESIGRAIGKFFGGIAEGIVESLSNALPTIGSNLSGFYNNASDFFTGMTGIGSEFVSGVGAFTAGIIKLGGAGVIDAIQRFFGGGILNYAKQLPETGAYLAAFTNSLNDVSSESISKAETLGNALAALNTSIPQPGVIKSILQRIGFLKTDIQVFTQDLPQLAGGIKAFTNSVSSITDDDIDKATRVGNFVSELSASIPEYNFLEKLGWLKSSATLFGEDMIKVGEGIAGFAKSIESGVDADAVQNAVNAMDILSAFEKDLKPNQGFLGWLTGQQDLGDFGDNMGYLGEGLSKLGKSINLLELAKVNIAIPTLQAILDFANSVGSESYQGVWDMAQLADSFMNVGEEAFKAFSGAFSNDGEKGTTLGETFIDSVYTAMTAKEADFTTAGEAFVSAVQVGFGNKADDILTMSENICNAIISGINPADDKVSNAGADFMGKFIAGVYSEGEDLTTMASNIVTAILTIFSNSEESTKTSGKNFATNWGNGFVDAVPNIVGSIKELFMSVANSISTSASSFVTAGENVGAGFAKGISNMKSKVQSAASSVANAARSAMSVTLAIHSPSRVMEELGNYAGEGFALGIAGTSGQAVSASEGLIDRMLSPIETASGIISDILSNNIDMAPTIRPVIDMTDINTASEAMDSIFSAERSARLTRGQTDVVYRNVQAIQNMVGSDSRALSGSNRDIVNAVEALGGKFDDLNKSVSSMKVVTDTGALVGQISTKMDKSLGQQAVYKGRGN